MSPVGLSELLEALPRPQDPELLVGFETSDDAAVYRLAPDRAIVSTADLITPPVDDGKTFGRVAAANALSDVYAMGGRPILALSLVGFPSQKLDASVLAEMITGLREVVEQAGAVLAGGHTTEDDEPKLGLAVTGLVHPDEVWRNSGARPGDALVLTKPLGSGVLFNANLKGKVSKAALEGCLEALTTLNARAAEVLRGFEVHAATDVTGFGLAGHTLEVAQGSEVTCAIDVDALPIYDEAIACYERGVTTGVNAANRALVAPHARFARSLPAAREEIVFDPQTSGGLLAAVPEARAGDAVAALRAAGVAAACVIGRVTTRDGGPSVVFA
ncbi:MAG: selenide, water dikinase SelD [Myxococcota bacterium]|nr:selenide, water dikinase SelD [Myxococcota bacterium]